MTESLIVQILGLGLWLMTVIVGALTILSNTRVNRINKRADVILHCNNRHDEICKYKIHISKRPPQADIAQYFSRYWALKNDQFDYWLAGWVDIETFCSWFYSTLISFRQENFLGNRSFVWGWMHIGRVDNRSVNPWFLEFVDRLMKLSEMEGVTIFDVIKEVRILTPHAKAWRQRVRGHWLWGEMSIDYYEKSLKERGSYRANSSDEAEANSRLPPDSERTVADRRGGEESSRPAEEMVGERAAAARAGGVSRPDRGRARFPGRTSARCRPDRNR